MTVPLTFTAITPASVVVQASPTAIAPNTSGTANRSTLLAVVRDASGNLVANKTVNFTITSGTGSLSAASSSTDSEGKAQVQYIAGSTTTAQNGVVVTATVEGTAVSGTAALTVSGQSLFINFFTGNGIESFDTNTYRLPVTVSVTDANGVAVATQAVGFSVWARNYDKGSLSWDATAGAWGLAVTASSCANEDTNKNGILNTGEDLNTDGLLWPGSPASLQSGSVTTDSNGLATVYVLFGKNYALWVRVDLTATVSVSGSESSRIYTFLLPILLDDRTTETPAPANATSPFGTAVTCTSPL